MKRVLAAILILCMMAPLFSGCSMSSNGKKLTIMMYVVGSDLESEGGCASADFQEILNSDLDLNQVNYLIYTGGSKSWKQNISSRINSVFQVTETNGSKQMELVSQTDSAYDMGDPNQLSSFLNFAYENYPADQFGLICWNHGGGPNQGFGYDENFEDFLEVSEFSSAFENSNFKGENKLDWIGFDACLMGSVEIGDALKNYANYLIASEELEPGAGWDYSFLSELKGDYSPRHIAQTCIDTFYTAESVSALMSYGSLMTSGIMVKPPVTLSCVDLQKIEPLNQAINTLFSAMDSSLQGGNILPLVYSRQSLNTFGMTSSTASGTELDLVDIGELASVSVDYPTESQAVQTALNDYVVYSKSGIEGAAGASIYYPFSGVYTFMLYGGSESYGNYDSSPGYVNYIRNFTDECYRGIVKQEKSLTRGTSALEGAQADGDKITVTLSEAQKKTFSRAYVNILEDTKYMDEEYMNNDYVGLLLDYQVEPDADGNITIDADLSVPVVINDNEQNFWPMRQISSKGGRSVYQTLRTLVLAAPEEMPFTAWEHVSFNAELEDGSDELEIIGISYADDTGFSLGKKDVDLDNWNYYQNNTVTRMMKKNEDGTLPPFSEWESRDTLLMRDSPIEQNTLFKMVPLSECSYGDYYYQIVIEDVNGNQQASDLFAFTKGEKYEEVVEKTASGELTYRVFADRVEVAKYDGNDSKLVIPATYKNLPVKKLCKEFITSDSSVGELVIEGSETELAYRCFFYADVKRIILPEGLREIPGNAFSHCYAEEIKLPSTLLKIGRRAFASCYCLKELVIPAGVEEIDVGAFSNLEKSNHISFAGENKNYKIENDFLLSKDGKILYSRFTESNDCIVPDGVEEIASWGCLGVETRLNKAWDSLGADNTVRSVKLPDSLRIIRSDAFRNSELTELTIPDSVRYIGHNAFANYTFSYQDPTKVFAGETAPEHVSVKIGSGLSWIGKDVFGYNEPVSVEVSENNAYFSSVDGKLMNKAGDHAIELAVPSNSNTEREVEYKTLEYVRSLIDMTNYENALSDEYTYDGNTYYTAYFSKDKTDPKLSPSVTLDGVKLDMPCKVSELLQAGLRFNNPADAERKLEVDESGYGSMIIYFENAQGKKLEAYVRNSEKKEISINDATVTDIYVDAKDGVEFRSNGLSCTMDIKTVTETLPISQISVDYSDDKTGLITLLYKTEQKYDDHTETISITLTYNYNLETGEITPRRDGFDYDRYNF